MTPKDYNIHFIISQANHQQKYARALIAGMKRHGYHNIKTYSSLSYNSGEIPDLAVMWSHKRKNIIQKQKEFGKNYLIMERAYLGNRHEWVSLGFNGLNGNSNFNNNHITDSRRFQENFSQYLKDWKTGNSDYVLVCGQVPGDASHSHININHWYETIFKELNDKGIDFRFRKHPLDRSFQNDFNVKLDKHDTLEESLNHASCCITFSSNSGVISAISGVPTVAYDPTSMAWNVSGHDCNTMSFMPDRTDWCNKLAYCQWLPHELEDGTTWNHLKSFIDNQD